jgi:hypothetical protein
MDGYKTIEQLIDIMIKENIKGYAGKTKAQLIDMLIQKIKY